MRTTGRVQEVLACLETSPERVDELVECISHANPGVRLRAADALQKASAADPSLLSPFKERILAIAETSNQQEVQWHCAEMFRVFDLSAKEAERARTTMLRYYETSKSAIVKADALETLALLAIQHPRWLGETSGFLEEAVKIGRGAVAARGRKALKLLKKCPRKQEN